MITISLTLDEYDYLYRLLGGPSEQSIKTLGQGLTADGAITLRQKLARLTPVLTPDEAMAKIEAGEIGRYAVPGEWTAFMGPDGIAVVEYHCPA
jgi:hypothetical protein